MDVEKLAEIEALLFAAEDPVEISQIAEIVNISQNKINEYLEVLEQEYTRDSHGLELKCYNNSYILVTKPRYASSIRELYDISKRNHLTKAALETLAIIAYKQPVTRAEIEEIRGVKAEKTLNTLGKYELIKELGRKDTIGNPIVYGTTAEFLKHFDIKNLSQLPDIEEFREQDQN